MSIGFWDYMSLGRPQWRGQMSVSKALFFLLLGSPDAHTRVRNAHVLNLVQRLPLPSKARVLDIGSGRGVALFWLARHHPDWTLIGIELDPVMAGSSRMAAKRGGWANLTFVQDSATNLFEEKWYDLVLCVDVLEHITDDVGLLRQIARALKPGGYLVLHVPKRRQEQWRLLNVFNEHRVSDHVRDEYIKEELQQRFADAGLCIREFQHTLGRWGEISFELNMLAWRRWWLRNLLMLLTYPVAIPIGYIDIRQHHQRGNGFLVSAQRM
jgi:2-polyprenyl-3-methyl-5-hydroxy-6-metoxy-1,4-benzoquinol methylase